MYLIIGACIAEYIYYISSNEGYFLTIIFVAIIGALFGLVVYHYLRMIPSFFAIGIVCAAIIWTLIAIIKVIEFLSEIQLW